MKYDIGVSEAIIISSHNGYKPFVGSIGIVGKTISLVKVGGLCRDECNVFINATGKILMPGLFNIHCHGDMTLARGLGDSLTLAEQNELFAEHDWFYSFINDEDRYYSRQLTYCEALLSGTTFIVENMYWSLGKKSVNAMSEVGIKGALAEDIRVSFKDADAFIGEKELIDFETECKANNIIPVIGSISEEDFQTERLININRIINQLSTFQTFHLAENDWRVKLIQDKYQSWPIEYLYNLNLLNENVIASHVVYATKKEIKQLAQTKTVVANTPLCEMKIADGIAPIPEMIKKGVLVCLGTDGAMWNNSNDIFREMKGMSLLHSVNSGVRSLGLNDILDMATINGAKAFKLDGDYGTIEEGKKATFILIETNVPHLQPIRLGKYENVRSMIVYNATGQDVTDVFIDGKHIVKDRTIQTIDVNKIINKVQETSNRISESLQKNNY